MARTKITYFEQDIAPGHPFELEHSDEGHVSVLAAENIGGGGPQRWRLHYTVTERVNDNTKAEGK